MTPGYNKCRVGHGSWIPDFPPSNQSFQGRPSLNAPLSPKHSQAHSAPQPVVVSNLCFCFCFCFFFPLCFCFSLLNFPGQSTPVSQLGSSVFPEPPDPFQPLGADSGDPFQNKKGFGDPFSGKDPFAPSSSAKPPKASSSGFADFTSVS